MCFRRVCTFWAFRTILLCLSVSQVMATPGWAENFKPGEASEVSRRLPIKALKRSLETKPSYTEAARLAGVEGTVVLFAEIAKDGAAENLRVLRSLGYGLDEEAIKAVRQWRFEPDPESRASTRVGTYVPVRFQLDRQIYGARLSAKSGHDIFQISEGGIVPPKILARVHATYTEEARTANIQGTIVLFAEITSTGTVENVAVLYGLEKGMDENAVQSIKQWKFAPATKDGRPVAVMMTIEMNFRLG